MVPVVTFDLRRYDGSMGLLEWVCKLVVVRNSRSRCFNICQPRWVGLRLMIVRVIVYLICLATLPCFAAGPEIEMPFTAQPPVSPGLYDAPLTSTRLCTISYSPLLVRWQEPSAGVKSTTGLVVVFPGANPVNDCVRPTQYADPTWPDTKNVVMCTVFYRNQAFSTPFDWGKLQISDALRGIGLVLQRYPQIDRRRLYLYGASAGGLLTLQLLQCTRQLWAEAHVMCAPTLITTLAEAQGKYHNDSLGEGFNAKGLAFPEQQGSLADSQWNRYQGERALRGPHNNMPLDLVSRSAGEYPYVWAMQGTADEGVDIQHLYELVAIVKAGTGVAGTHTTVVGGERWKFRNWTLFTVIGGQHDFSGADSRMNSYSKATNYRVPDAFTRLRPSAPTLTVDYAFPQQYGWRFHVQGALATVTVTVDGPAAAADSEWLQMTDESTTDALSDLAQAEVPRQ